MHLGKKIVTFLTSVALICSVEGFAAENNMNKSGIKNAVKGGSIQYYPTNDTTNHIPFLDNRFRIDAELDEIKMIFYRKAGAQPVILVRPDGSKIRVNSYDKNKVEWYDDVAYDMIKIKKPMPGPWQAIGQILPQSEILVVTDVKIEVPPLPQIMLSGETLKVTGKLVNGDEPITNPHFRNVVELIVQFFSTNNASYDNFGAEPVEITRFVDDGHGLDEYANDGIFTGEFTLAIPAGEWIPVYKVDMPMAKRELKQKAVMIQRNPISFKVDITKDAKSFHVVHLQINPEYVDPQSVIFQGAITFPDKQSEPFSILDGEGIAKDEKGNVLPNEKIVKFGYTEPGIHKIKVSAFGKTREGREFRLEVPQYTFNVERNEQEMLAQISDANGGSVQETPEEHALKVQQELEQAQLEMQKQAQQQAKMRWIIIGSINGAILLLAIVGFGVMRWRKKKQAS